MSTIGSCSKKTLDVAEALQLDGEDEITEPLNETYVQEVDQSGDE